MLVFADIKKNKMGTKITKVYLDEYKGKESLHIREFYQGDDGEFYHTKKGVTFDPEKLGEIIKALQKAEMKLKERVTKKAKSDKAA